MKRIYLDSNVFQLLKREDNSPSIKLYPELKMFLDRFVFYFSYAHILDLESDKTNNKFGDLKFMEGIVQQNFLTIPNKNNELSLCHSVTPSEAFKNLADPKSFKEHFQIDNLFDNQLLNDLPELTKLKKLFDILMNTKIKTDFKSDFSEQPRNIQTILNNLIPELKDEYSFAELVQNMLGTVDNLYSDKSIYKGIRKNSIDTLKLRQKYSIDINEVDFNEDLRNTPIQKTFLELVNETMQKNIYPLGKFDFFITAFNLLNILGIDNESNKKARFTNNLYDSQHAFYAAHCDYLVSNDEGLILKAKVLYKLLDIETKTLTLNEFKHSVRAMANETNLDLVNYTALINYELQNAFVIARKVFPNRKNITFKTSSYHFGFFNRIDFVSDKYEGQFYILYNDFSNYSTFLSHTEFELITNNIVKVFGEDDYFRHLYSIIDTEEIKKSIWKGRTWTIGHHCYNLHYNTDKGDLCLALSIN